MKARDEAARKAAPPRKLILTVDGAPIISTVIEGTGSFGYSQGEFTARATVKAGERFLRASYPELANLADPRENINPDMRRGLFVDYLDIVGPFNPSTAPPESYKRIFICSQKTPQCARTILSSLMERAYRRPVTEEELESKLDLVALAQREGDTFQEGIRLALQAILASPNFLFRIEANPRAEAAGVETSQRRGAPCPGSRAAERARAHAPHGETAYPVSDVELASRLSYFLWASMPDSELMRVAKAGTLRQPAVLEAQVRRMMADPKGHNLVDNWAAQWLQLRNLGRTKPDPKRFPTVDDELLDAMRKRDEHVHRDDHQGRSKPPRLHRRAVHLRQRSAGPSLRHQRRGWRGVPARDARRRAAQRRADAGRDPHRVVLSHAHVDRRFAASG